MNKYDKLDEGRYLSIRSAYSKTVYNSYSSIIRENNITYLSTPSYKNIFQIQNYLNSKTICNLQTRTWSIEA
jgi:hypothetical protein